MKNCDSGPEYLVKDMGKGADHRSWHGMILACLMSALLLGCPGSGETQIVVLLEADTYSGQVPLDVSFTTENSVQVGGEESITYRWDLDGDGEWDDGVEEDASSVSYTYVNSGVAVVSVEMTTENGQTGTGQVIIQALDPLIDIDADSNRDGTVNAQDDIEEDSWNSEKGAIVFANIDDDDGDNRFDANDQIVNGDADMDDLVPLVLQGSSALRDSDTVTLAIEPVEAADYIRLFQKDEEGAVSVLYTPGYPSIEIEAAILKGDAIEILAESASARSASWDDLFTLQVQVERDGEIIAEDNLAMRVAPIVFPDNLLRPEIVYIMDITDPSFNENSAFFDAVEDNLPSRVQLFGVDQYLYGGDRWVQDSMQTGYQLVPGGNADRRLLTYMNLERGGGGLETFIPDELFGPDLAFVFTTGSQPSGLNYGGNLEIAPPYETSEGESFPLGRVLVGGGDEGSIFGYPYEDHMGIPQRRFFDAQEVQAPTLELSTEWLIVGHLDEIFLFIPDLREDAERSFKVLFASPNLAKRILEDTAQDGGGSLSVFDGRQTETTVNGILGDEDLMDYNALVQNRIDSIRAQLVAAMDLSQSDIIEVPVLFEYSFYGPLDLSVAYNPGIQNLVVVGETLFVPDPEGPNVAASGDPWKINVQESLEPLGLDVIFVDVFDSYHLLLGEAHCGSNIQRVAHDTKWWTQ